MITQNNTDTEQEQNEFLDYFITELKQLKHYDKEFKTKKIQEIKKMLIELNPNSCGEDFWLS